MKLERTQQVLPRWGQRQGLSPVAADPPVLEQGCTLSKTPPAGPALAGLTAQVNLMALQQVGALAETLSTVRAGGRLLASTASEMTAQGVTAREALAALSAAVGPLPDSGFRWPVAHSLGAAPSPRPQGLSGEFSNVRLWAMSSEGVS